MGRTALLYAVPALLVTTAWLQLEEDAQPGGAVWLALLALVPALVRPLWARALATILVLGAAARTAFGVSPLEARPADGGHDYFGPLLSRVSEGALDFYDVALPFSPGERPLMHGAVVLAVFGFCLPLGQAVAARRPLVAGLVLLAGVAWPTTLIGGGDLRWGAVILATVLGLLAAGGRRPPRSLRQASVAGLVLVLAALAGATSPAVAKGEFLTWQRWDPYDRPDDPVGVRYVWNSNYRGIDFPDKRTTVLTVRGSERALYWRATTLDVFRRDNWLEELPTIRRSSEPVELTGDPFTPPGARDEGLWVRANVTIEALRDTHLVGPSMPVAYDPAGMGEVEYRSGGVAVLPQGLARGQTYSVWSYAPRPTPQQLARVRPSALRRQTLESQYLEVAPGVRTLPFGTPGREQELLSLYADEGRRGRRELAAYRPLADRARQVVGPARSPYAATVAVEAWLRAEGGFVYDEQPGLAGGAPPLVQFVTGGRRGYCQQFAGSMALMLRYLGIPARVAVGFTSGTYSREERRWTVTDHDAHAWVEVWFEGWGWLPFDPTPGRGRLSGSYTSASSGFDAAAVGALVGGAAGALSALSRRSTLDERRVGDGNQVRERDLPGDIVGGALQRAREGASLLRLLGLVAGGLLAALLLAKLVRRGRRFLTRDPRRVAAACRDDLVDFLTDQRIPVARSATARELGRTVERELAIEAEPFVRAVSSARYGPPGASAEAARLARRELRALRRRLRRGLGSGRRVRGLLSLRSLGFNA